MLFDESAKHKTLRPKVVHVTERALLLKNFLDWNDEKAISEEVLRCHTTHTLLCQDDRCTENGRDIVGCDRCSDDSTIFPKEVDTSPRSYQLNLGIDVTGGNIATSLPLLVSLCRKIFQNASRSPFLHSNKSLLVSLGKPETVLTGTALLYGPHAYMKPHYDSPTQPNQREEWLCIINLGLTAVFRCNESTCHLKSGDVLVMDSMAVLHGVEKIIVNQRSNDIHRDSSLDHSSIATRWRDLGLPSPSRLGIVVWQGTKSDKQEESDPGIANSSGDPLAYDSISVLFGNEEQGQEDEL